jgi:phenylpropionate dioxygenase-like ring-hydroxylating dioxygenase large terminal subunit
MKNRPQHPLLSRFYHPVLKAADLKNKPIQVKIGKEKIVLYRDRKGVPHALIDQCPHRLSPLSQGQVRGDNLTCPYHGWQLNEEGEATAPNQNIKHCRIRKYFVKDQYDYLWISSEKEAQLPSVQQEDFIFLGSYEIKFDCSLELALDNFSEDEHFPFVHSWFGWDEEGAKHVEHNWQLQGDEVHVRYLGPQRNFLGMRSVMIYPGEYFENNWIAKYDPPNISYTVKMLTPDGKVSSRWVNRATIFFVPIGENQTILRVFQFSKMRNPRWNFIVKIFRANIIRNTIRDFKNDQKFVKMLSSHSVSAEIKNMRLGKYDGPVYHGRKLLNEIYYSLEPQSETLGAHRTKGISENRQIDSAELKDT